MMLVHLELLLIVPLSADYVKLASLNATLID